MITSIPRRALDLIRRAGHMLGLCTPPRPPMSRAERELRDDVIDYVDVVVDAMASHGWDVTHTDYPHTALRISRRTVDVTTRIVCTTPDTLRGHQALVLAWAPKAGWFAGMVETTSEPPTRIDATVLPQMRPILPDGGRRPRTDDLIRELTRTPAGDIRELTQTTGPRSATVADT